jgi:hypothetical protein
MTLVPLASRLEEFIHLGHGAVENGHGKPWSFMLRTRFWPMTASPINPISAYLTEHLQKNIKDHSSRRGLLVMVGQRRRLLDYLHHTDLPRYQTVTKKAQAAPLILPFFSSGNLHARPRIWPRSISLARKREQADAQDEFRGNKVPLTWGDFNQHLTQMARPFGVD